MNLIKGVRTSSVLTGETYGIYAMAIPCQASQEEGVTTIGSSPSTVSIDTALEVHTNLIFKLKI